MDEKRVNELDKICNKIGYTHNKLINLMVVCIEKIRNKIILITISNTSIKYQY